MGSVNLDAMREHAEAEERFTYYSTQKADLEKAARIGRAAYRLGWQVAQGREAPKQIKAESKEKAGPAITSN